MIKKILLMVLAIYQNFFSFILKNILGVGNCCRFEISCSEYAKISIQKYGVIQGGALTIKRLASCQPFYHGKGLRYQ